LKPPVKVTETTDQDAREYGEEDDQEKRDGRDFPVMIQQGVLKGHFLPVLQRKMDRKKDDKEKDNHPEESFHLRFNPFRFTVVFRKLLKPR
jgi:hypothetical protein